MKDYNKEKADQLGMPVGTASNRLRKMIMFALLAMQGLDICHQCNQKILSVEELSVEHKEPWLNSEDPKAKFFDLNNIAFSHLLCNIGAARKPTKLNLTEDERKERYKKMNTEYARKSYTPEKRREKYLRSGY